MAEFDYAKAWRDAARPAYQALPQNVRDLLAQVATEAGGLAQLPDCSMPWPDNPQLGKKGTPDSDLRAKFDKIPAEVLAFAARVVYSVGHWYPNVHAVGAGGVLDVPGRETGAHWKFTHYADQSLRARLAAETSADQMRVNGPFRVHEGTIRFCYESRDMWTWHEVAPATEVGLERAKEISRGLSIALGTATAEISINAVRQHREARDGAAYSWFEELKARDLDWPAEWRPFVDHRFMVESRDAIEVLPEERTVQVSNERAKVLRQYEEEIRKATGTRDAMLWCLDHGLTTDNVIFYDHRGVLTFGWRDKLGPNAAQAVLAAISEWPGAYEIRALDRVYRNAEAEIASKR